MNIEYITSSFPRHNVTYGGIFIYNQVKNLAKNHEIHVIYPTKKRILPNEMSNLHLHEISYPFDSYTLTQINSKEYLQLGIFCKDMFNKIKDVNRKYDIDIMHSHWSIPSGFISSLNFEKIPRVITIHGSDLKIYGKKSIYGHLIKLAIKRADKIIVVSNDLKNLAISQGCNPEKLRVIPNGVDIDLFKPMNQENIKKQLNISSNFLVTYIGTLAKIKRIDILIQICKDISKNYDIDLLIVGEGPERTKLEEYAKNIGMSNIIFQGNVNHDQIPKYLAASNVVALTSESEGLPTILVEAMSCGIPVITMNVGGVSDIIENNVNGFIVADQYEFKEKLECLINNSNLRVTFGKKARSFIVNKHSIETVTCMLEQLYQELINDYPVQSKIGTCYSKN
jgi:Glycosyltransferase